jgi:multiple sugar transport system permease protein
MPIESFLAVSFKLTEQAAPFWQQSYFPLEEARYADFLEIRRACKDHRFTPGVRRTWLAHLRAEGRSWTNEGDVFPIPASAAPDLKADWLEFEKTDAPAAIAVPFALRTQWRAYLDSEDVRRELKLKPGASFSVADYNRLAGTQYASLAETPFPLPPDAPETIAAHWRKFVEERYPLRLTEVRATPALEEKYREFLRERLRTIESANKLLETKARDWTEFRLSAGPPSGPGSANLRGLWAGFVKGLPVQDRVLGGSEASYQRFLLKKYQDVDAINIAYGWKLARIEEAAPPFDVAYAVTFLKHEAAFVYEPVLENYAAVWKFLTETGNALFVTLALIGLTIFFTLTVNPIAAYALSRFNMRGQDKIILYMLATTAFPAMVSAIPAYLLMRDLGLLNTMLALVLPGAANGMAIFILKGFFDSLPQELFEAAVIDGATEWQIFRIVAMPLIKPILAINALTAFILAYNGWEWALIICQDRSMWTVAVWLYQANEWWAYTPWITTAGFVLASIPTLLVFIFCQKVILRGIIIPSMK